MTCGIDEAGRGPLAGPVAAAAVVLPADFPFDVLGDSKALSPKRREFAAALIYKRAIAWSIGWAHPFEIDELNILNATFLAMERAFRGIRVAVDSIIVDGNRKPPFDPRCVPIVKADSTVPEVMAASILAKTARDRAMERFDWLYPEYGYARHKGYPTAAHRAACIELGPSPIQRLTFTVRVDEVFATEARKHGECEGHEDEKKK
ncbi:MAG: ribonuclease HII [Spirochaetes bacterium]|nr:ribonuclease HII [Spirochaetota bacterium]